MFKFELQEDVLKLFFFLFWNSYVRFWTDIWLIPNNEIQISTWQMDIQDMYSLCEK